jgi:hypothetical protein
VKFAQATRMICWPIRAGGWGCIQGGGIIEK